MPPTKRRRTSSTAASDLRQPDQAAPAPVGPAGTAAPNGNGDPRWRSQTSQRLTTAGGVPLPDTDHSLKAGDRGPTLLEDFHLREKITHFDHERIPERVVHARGAAAHGVFTSLRDSGAAHPGRRSSRKVSRRRCSSGSPPC